jgi:hypothetical protein
MAMIGDYSHAADLSGRQQQYAPDALPGFIQREKVQGVFIVPVPLDLSRHALFDDEYHFTDVPQLLPMSRPVNGYHVYLHT